MSPDKQAPQSEAELLLAHDYDGIRELDNRLPGWWVWLFYLTSIFAVGYLAWYHVLHRGPSATAAYSQEVAEAQRLGLGIHYQAWGPEVAPTEDPAAVAGGKAVFVRNCVVCHGEKAEGKIGPNLTDDYFLHGPSFAEMVKVIEDGVPDKGMITWKLQLSRDEVREVASYAYSLRGTNPPNPKAPQGVQASAGAAPAAPGVAATQPATGDGASAAGAAAAPAAPATAREGAAPGR